MTVVPLIVALLITGISSGSDSARAGGVAGRSVLWFVAVLTLSAIVGGLAMTTLIELFPLPTQSAEALRSGLAGIDQGAAAASVPKLADFVNGLLPSNPFAAAAADQILPLVLFTALFAFALTRVETELRGGVVRFFQATERALLVLIGWILWLAPYGVFALAFAVGAGAGGEVFGALLHYIVLVSTTGWIMIAVGVLIAWLAAGWSPARFFPEMIPSLAVAVSTQSSLASLPAMLASSRRLGWRGDQRRRAAACGRSVPRDRPGDERRGRDLRRLLARRVAAAVRADRGDRGRFDRQLLVGQPARINKLHYFDRSDRTCHGGPV